MLLPRIDSTGMKLNDTGVEGGERRSNEEERWDDMGTWQGT